MSSLFSNKSQSTQSTSTAYNTSNQQVGVSQGGVGIGAGSSGNTVNISTTDSADLQASLNASVQALQGANATALAGLNAGGAVAGAGLATALQMNNNSTYLVGGAINAINNANANQDTTLNAITQSFTAALSQATNASAGLAAGALNQSQQIAAGAVGVPVSNSPYDISAPSVPLSSTTELLIGLAAAGLVLYVVSKQAA